MESFLPSIGKNHLFIFLVHGWLRFRRQNHERKNLLVFRDGNSLTVAKALAEKLSDAELIPMNPIQRNGRMCGKTRFGRGWWRMRMIGSLRDTSTMHEL
jgi:hypothetical protein